MAKSDATAMAKAFEGMAVEENGVRTCPVPDPECMVFMVQMCGVVWERAALQAAVAALYESMEWSKSRSFTLLELEKVVGLLEEARKTHRPSTILARRRHVKCKNKRNQSKTSMQLS